MPALIQHIDAIARKKGHDALYLEFHPQPFSEWRDYLEHPDGTMRHGGVRFHVMPLDYPMENAAHDEPGFRERWAVDF